MSTRDDLLAAAHAAELGLVPPSALARLLDSPPSAEGAGLLAMLHQGGLLSPQQCIELEQRVRQVDASGACATLSAGAERTRAAIPLTPQVEVTTLAAGRGGGTQGGVLPASTPAVLRSEGVRNLGRYRLGRELGRGGMGVVYLAFDTELRREVALKTLSLEGSMSRSLVERLQREAQTAAALHHPGIVPVHDAGTIDGVPYLAMGFVRGRTLGDALLAQPPASLRERVRWVADAADAVAHAHAHQIIHRDLKPANVMLDESGVVRVLDFGLARRIEGETALTRSGETVGTPLYMAPEQMSGSRLSASPAADVYSLGAVLYEALAGRPPFPGETMGEVVAKVLTVDVVPLRHLDERIPPDLETICLRALQKEPPGRFPSARELADELTRWLRGEAIHSRPETLRERLMRKARSNRAATTLAGLILLCAVAAAAWFGSREWSRRARVAAALLDSEDSLNQGEFESALRHASEGLQDSPGDSRFERLRSRARAECSVVRGEAEFARYRRLRATAVDLGVRRVGARGAAEGARTHADKTSFWLMAPDVERAEREAEQAFALATAAFTEALGHWNEHGIARERIADLHWDRWQRAEQSRDRAGMDLAAALVREFGGTKYASALRGERRVCVRFVIPRGFSGEAVAAHLFRYERTFAPPVMVPVPCDPQTGEVLTAAQLGAVEPIALATLAGLKAGMAGAPVDDPTRQHILATRWGSALPLDARPENRLALQRTVEPGRGAEALTFEAKLPRGSYLLYFPPGGVVYETRYPFEVSSDSEWDETCELILADAGPPLPPGVECLVPPSASAFWVYVPAGPYRASGDPQASQSPPRDPAFVRVPDATGTAGYFVARFETTVGMYRLFLEDDATHGSPETAFRHMPRQGPVATEQSALWSRAADGTILPRAKLPYLHDDVPVFGISGQDGTDYARWVTERCGGGHWTYELPSEDEWERAARGVDGRSFPTGDEFDPSFARIMPSRESEQPQPQPDEPAGLFPLDESPFGVRDVAGLVREWTSTTAGEQAEYRVLKGGTWAAPSSLSRLASRSCTNPMDPGVSDGIRLIARRRP